MPRPMPLPGRPQALAISSLSISVARAANRWHRGRCSLHAGFRRGSRHAGLWLLCLPAGMRRRCSGLPPRRPMTTPRRVIARVTIVAENPSDHHIFLSSFVGERGMRSTSFGIEIIAGQGLIESSRRKASPFAMARRHRQATPRFSLASNSAWLRKELSDPLSRWRRGSRRLAKPLLPMPAG